MAQTTAEIEARLKRVISLPQALSVAFHQIVGAGIVALTGVAIGLTGGGTPLAFVLAAAAVLIYSLPYAALTSAMPVTGGFYTYPARLFSPSVGFGTMWIFIALEAGISVYPLTAATYVHALFPQIPVTPLAVGVQSCSTW
jgi:APA family basic amino acid/polyamine antiporter